MPRQESGSVIKPSHCAIELVKHSNAKLPASQVHNDAMAGRVDPLVLMRLAGHSSYQVTANIYTHLQKKRVKQAAVGIDGVFSQ